MASTVHIAAVDSVAKSSVLAEPASPSSLVLITCSFEPLLSASVLKVSISADSLFQDHLVANRLVIARGCVRGALELHAESLGVRSLPSDDSGGTAFTCTVLFLHLFCR